MNRSLAIVFSKNTTGSVPSNGELDNVCVDEDKPSTRPSTPPSRLEAFEMFKKGRGKELKKIFLQNKGIIELQILIHNVSLS